MEQYVIKGGRPLEGEVTIAGAKNAALGILAAAVMTDQEVTIENVPNVRDTRVLLQAIQGIGARVRYIDEHTVAICGGTINPNTDLCVDDEYIRKIRASYYLLGALLGKYNHSQVALPGGCDIGARPIDLHIKGFEALGAHVDIANGMISVEADELIGSHIYMDVISVGATINVMMAAVMANGKTTIENAAKEPHIVDVANFLNSMGANIKGAGTDVIRIRGVKSLHGTTYSIIPDQIEAGSYMVAAAVTGGDVTVRNVIPKHLEPITAKLRLAGCEVEEFDESVRVRRTGDLHPLKIKTMPHPGFPTDLQPLFAVMLCLAKGTSIITEGIWENRFRYADELAHMGANIQVDGQVAVIEGVDSLQAAPLRASDLRAGAALVVAALGAKGTSEVDETSHIERGYENIVEKFQALGADIKRVDKPVLNVNQAM